MPTIRICHIEKKNLRKYSISFKSPFESFKIIRLIVLIAIFFITNQKEHINKYNLLTKRGLLVKVHNINLCRYNDKLTMVNW